LVEYSICLVIKMYEQIGGWPVIEKLVDDFYLIMSTDPVAKDCFATHANRDIQESSHKLKFFLSGWLGGPQLYLEKFGHPRLRMRHHSFMIGVKEAEQWLYCMKKALSLSEISLELQSQLFGSFVQVAQMLINKND
jgi:hemoglobin